MKKALLISALIFYGAFMWSAGWVSVRIYDSGKPTTNERPAQKTSSEATETMLQMINQERRERNIAPVKYDATVAKAAEAKACEMKNRGYFAHQDPDGRYGWHFLTENGVNYESAGENIAESEKYVDHVGEMRGFMNSPKHRDIILDPIYTTVGYGTCGLYTVQFFIR